MAAGVAGLRDVFTPDAADALRDRGNAATRPESRRLFHLEMLARGIYIAQRGYMTLSLAMIEDQLDRFCAAFDEVLSEHGDVLGGA